MAIIKILTAKQARKEFRPYAVALGELVYAWGRLYSILGALFWSVSGQPKNSVPTAVWNSVTNDRAQREMLKAAAAVAPLRNYAADEIAWIVDRADALSDNRNDAIHSPYFLSISDTGVELQSNFYGGSPRALKLRGKNLMAEFILYRERAETLAEYAAAIHNGLLFPEKPWPQRPPWPKLDPSKTHKRLRPRKRAK